MATSIDLTGFGFTPTENLVYARLLDGGPAGGYAVSRDLLIARANVYQALRGLVLKGAAVAIPGNPQRFRALKPADLFAHLVEEQGRRLDTLAAQIASSPEGGAETFVSVTGERAFLELASRSIVRDTAPALIVAPIRILSPLLPALRKRATEGVPPKLWILGDAADFPLAISGTVPSERAETFFGAPAAAVALDQSVLVAHLGDDFSGFWSSDRAVAGVTRAALFALTSPPV